MIYILYFTFWFTSGEVLHSSTEAHIRHKIVTSKSACDKLARETQTRLELSCLPGNDCCKVLVECRHVNKSEYFSKRHHTHKDSNEVDNEIHKKRKRKSRPSKKSRLE